VPPAVRSLRSCKGLAGAGRGPHRGHPFSLSLTDAEALGRAVAPTQAKALVQGAAPTSPRSCRVATTLAGPTSHARTRTGPFCGSPAPTAPANHGPSREEPHAPVFRNWCAGPEGAGRGRGASSLTSSKP
jgi:hypothetical protein